MRTIFVSILSFILFATGVQAVEVNELPGYSRMTVSADFEEFLSKDKSLVRKLEEDTELSRLVMTRPVLQKQLMEKKVTIDELVETYFPNRDAKNAKDAEKSAFDLRDEQPAYSNQDRARVMINRAVAAAKNPQQQAQAEEQIDEITESLDDTGGGQPSANVLAQALAMMAIFRENPTALQEMLQSPEMQQLLAEGGLTVADVLAAMAALEQPQPEEQPATPEAPHAPEQPEAAADTFDISGVNVNAQIPESERGLDANGWPKYLKVPAECPPPAADIQYLHEPSYYSTAKWRGGEPIGFGPPAPRTVTGDVTHDMVAAGFDGHGSYAWLVLTQYETMALPFVTPNIKTSRSYHWAGDLGGQIAIQGVVGAGAELSISHCPGEFGQYYRGNQLVGNDITVPSGAPKLEGVCTDREFSGAMFYMTKFADEPLQQQRVCNLEPNKRYFFNIRVLGSAPEERETSNQACARFTRGEGPDLSELATRMVKGVERPLCSIGTRTNQVHGFDRSLRDTYTGPCLQRGPYPLNYNHLTCGATRPIVENPTANTEDGVQKAVYCYDPANKKPPLRIVRRIVNQQWRVVEGYNEPVYGEYLCEYGGAGTMGDTGGGVENSYLPGDVIPHHAVCHAGRAGLKRATECTRRGNVANAQPFLQGGEECRFDEHRGRYDWMPLASVPPRSPNVNAQGYNCSLRVID